jgi:transposase
MKAMSKSELADRAGVSLSTLTRWCKPYKDDLNAMGLQPNAKVLPPHIVKYLIEKFCIDI